MAPWIISHFPEHRFYVEPYGGAASVLLRKPRSFHEVYNDLDGDLVNLLSVIRDTDQMEKLIEQLKLTPFSREEFELSVQDSESPVEQARRTIVRSFMGFGSAATNKNHKTGFRSKCHRRASTAGSDWKNYPESLRAVGERLHGVIIERRNAIDLMRYQDSHETLFYIDPPYLHDTRHNGSERCYSHEMNNLDHEMMLSVIKRLDGMVVLSGYDNDLYNDCLTGWQKEYKSTVADGRGRRVEVVWVKTAHANERMRQGAFKTHRARTGKTEQSIESAILFLTNSGKKPNKSSVARMTGISREQISRRYSHLF